MYKTVVLDGDCVLEIPEAADPSLEIALDGEYGVITKVKEGEYYTGPVEVTPSPETQTLATTGFIMPSDVVINPIPSNYGLITWNGSTLTVS